MAMTAAQALEHAHIPSLLMSLVHLTGQTDLLRRLPRPVYDFFGDGQGGLTEDAMREVRDAVDAAWAAHQAAGAPPLAPLSAPVIQEMMDYIAGVDIPDIYRQFLINEIALGGAAARLHTPEIQASAEAKSEFPVLIIGAGMSGLLAAIHLKQAGLPFTIIERGSEVGGTWAQNLYPGCRVDTPNHLYSFSFEPGHAWPQHYSDQPALLAYFNHIADKYQLRSAIQFNTEVVRATYDAQRTIWQVQLKSAAGTQSTTTAKAVICAVGQLNRPSLPEIPGRDTFAGDAFHSARWNHDVALKGKRVAVIGTGASAFQFVPEIAGDVASLSIFQRSAPWLGPTPDYHFDVTPGKQWLLDHMPYYGNWYRFWLFWMLTDGILPYIQADPAWTGNRAAISDANNELRLMLEQWIADQTKDRPDLQAKVTPTYPPGSKRMLRDNGVWINALRRENVELIEDPIVAITPTGIRTGSGRDIAVEVIIYGTGFKASEFFMPIEIIGNHGVNLHDRWQGDARAYLGITMPDFPNFFSIYGPNTNIVVNGSIIFFSECAAHYIAGCIKQLVEGAVPALDVRRDVHDAFNARVDAGNAQMAWGQKDASSWYKNAHGRVAQNWPFALVDYWNATRAPDLDDFVAPPVV